MSILSICLCLIVALLLLNCGTIFLMDNFFIGSTIGNFFAGSTSPSSIQPTDLSKVDSENTFRHFRAKFYLGPGAVLFGWPSKGGVYVLESCFGVELEFLGLDRFQATLRPSFSNPAAKSADDDAWCDKRKVPFYYRIAKLRILTGLQ